MGIVAVTLFLIAIALAPLYGVDSTEGRRKL